MNNEPTQSAARKPADDEKRQRRDDSPVVWTIMHGDADFPRRLSEEISGTKFLEVHGIGDRSILKQQSLGLICSVQCPGSIVIQTFDAIRELRDAGIVVAGGFHSPMEKECLEFLLRGEQPVIVCPAKGLARLRMPAAWRAAMDAGRLLLISPFDDKITTTTKDRAATRNEFVAAISDVLFIPHASQAGQAEAVACQVLQRHQPLFTFADAENKGLLELGAHPYHLDEILRLSSPTSCPPSRSSPTPLNSPLKTPTAMPNED